MASRIFSIRLDDSAVEALEKLQISDDDSLNATAKRVLLASLGIDVNASVQGVNNASDERLQELIDAKTAYLATALNELKHSLESRIEQLENKLNQHEEWFTKADEVNQERNTLAQENWLLKSQLKNASTIPDATDDRPLLENELKSKINSIARTLKNRDKKISEGEIRKKILELFPNVNAWASGETRDIVIEQLINKM